MTLAADNLQAVFSKVPALSFSPCLWMLIVAAILTPVVWLGTPKDFWWVLPSLYIIETSHNDIC